MEVLPALLVLAVVIGIYLLIEWVVFNQFQNDNQIGVFLIYLVTSIISILLKGSFNLSSIISILISAAIAYGFSLFCYKRCQGTFGSYLLTEILWGIIFGIILYGIYFVLILLLVRSIV